MDGAHTVMCRGCVGYQLRRLIDPMTNLCITPSTNVGCPP
jgi:hypothetical protein